LNLFLITLSFNQALSGTDKCRGLAFSGGSDNGPY